MKLRSVFSGRRGRIFLAILCGVGWAVPASAADCPQWGGSDCKNMVSAEKNLPETFTPGERDPKAGGVIMSTTKNVKWVARLGSYTCGTPSVAGGKVFIGFCRDKKGYMQCLDEQTGKVLWQWVAPVRKVPPMLDGRKCWFTVFPERLGVCSTPLVDGERVYFVNQRCEVLCVSVKGKAPSAPASQEDVPAADVLWTFDMWDYGVRPSDACNGSIVMRGDLLYVSTSNGVDRDADAKKKDEFRKPPAPDAPSIIVLEKTTGRLVAQDSFGIGPRLLHGQWSSPSLGKVGDKTLLFYGGGDGVCYAMETLDGVPFKHDRIVRLKNAWSFDCNPPEYKQFGSMDLVTHYSLGDKRRSDTINKKVDPAFKSDPNFVGMSEIIATPVFCNNRVYVAIGRDPEHGRGRGALWCIDATKTGDITQTGKIWGFQGLERALATVSVADGLVYVSDMPGKLYCLDADTGKLYWTHESGAETWGSTLVADGKVYMPTKTALWILSHGKEKKVLEKISLGSAVWSTPVAANGTLYIASQNYLWAVKKM